MGAVLPELRQFEQMPRHISFIMDGNNRWAKKRLLPGPAGHRAGVEVVRWLLETCENLGMEVLSLFAFSSENWNRSKAEVNALMTLFSRYLKREVKQLNEDNVQIRFIGERHHFSEKLLAQIDHAEQLTKDNTGIVLVLAVDYGGQWDIAQAARALAEDVARGRLRAEQIDVELMDRRMSISDLPKPDLCVRTAGERRISNFMLWQFAYSEFHFSDTLWPDYSLEDLYIALEDFNNRERRYGGRLDDDSDE